MNREFWWGVNVGIIWAGLMYAGGWMLGRYRERRAYRRWTREAYRNRSAGRYLP